MRPRLILFALVFLRRHNAVLNPVGMKHRCGEIEEKQAKPPAGGSERSEENKNADWDGANHPEKTRDYSVRANRRQRTARPVGSGAYLRARRHPRSPSLSSFVLSKNNRGILFAHGTDSLSRQRASLPARNQQTGSLRELSGSKP